MSIPFLSRLFTKREQTPALPDSILVKKLKSFAQQKNYTLFENTPLFYRTEMVEIPLLLFIPRTGLVLFEYKEWSYEELKNAKVSKVSHAQKSENSLSFQSIGDFIREKFLDLTNFDEIDIYNFVIMEQLTTSEYEMLDESFKELVPQNRILFNDSQLEDIENKLSAIQTRKKNFTLHNTMPYIFSQYMIIGDDEQIYFANEEQRAFIEAPLPALSNLVADRQSGKSNVIVQKALLEKLKEPKQRITIAALTRLQADILKHLFLQFVEYSSVVIDMDEIHILTIEEILQRHAQKLKTAPFYNNDIHRDLLKKGFEFTDILFVDDAFLLSKTYIDYCKHIQKSARLLLVNSVEDEKTATLSKSYFGEFSFIQASEFPTLLKTIREIHQKDQTADILVFTNETSFEEIMEDIEGFTGVNVAKVDINKEIYSQNLKSVKLSVYDSKVPLHAEYALFVGCCDANYSALKYLAKASRQESRIIYEKECDNITRLKQLVENENEEDNQE